MKQNRYNFCIFDHNSLLMKISQKGKNEHLYLHIADGIEKQIMDKVLNIGDKLTWADTRPLAGPAYYRVNQIHGSGLVSRSRIISVVSNARVDLSANAHGKKVTQPVTL